MVLSIATLHWYFYVHSNNLATTAMYDLKHQADYYVTVVVNLKK